MNEVPYERQVSCWWKDKIKVVALKILVWLTVHPYTHSVELVYVIMPPPHTDDSQSVHPLTKPTRLFEYAHHRQTNQSVHPLQKQLNYIWAAFSIRKKVEGEVDKVGGGPAVAAADRCRADRRWGRVREGGTITVLQYAPWAGWWVNFDVVSHKFGDFCASRKQMNRSVLFHSDLCRRTHWTKNDFWFWKSFREVGGQNRRPPAPNEKAEWVSPPCL